MSRTEYKGLRIDWYPDECAAPLPKVPARSWKDHIPVSRPKTTTVAPVTNRFALLNTDGTESDSDDEEETKSFPGYGVRIDSWADAGIVA